MKLGTSIFNACAALLCAGILGCGSSGTGTMNVHLVDGPDTAYDHVNLQVKVLEIHGPAGWEVLADFRQEAGGVKEVDLLSLRGVDGKGLPIKLTLVDGKALGEGHYDQMRMVLGAGNTVTLAGTTTPVKLTVPSGMQSGVKFPVSFDVAAGTTRDVFIDFDAHRSIFVHEAGHAGKYLLRPVVRAVDRLVTGSVHGTLTAKVGGAPLPGVEVMAEVVQGGRPVVVRSDLTDSAGRYELNLLPAGGSYYVVAQPVVGAAVYLPGASAVLAITEATPTWEQDLSFDAALPAIIGSVGGTISPAVASSEQTDTVAVQASFDGTPPLIVREVPASVTTLGETYQVSNLPAFGTGYLLAVERATVDTAGATTVAWNPDAGGPVLSAGAAVLSVPRNLTVAP